MTFFDGSQDDEKVLDSLGQLPDGAYHVCVANLDKQWSRNNNKVGLLKAEFDVLNEEWQGRKIFQNFIMVHPTSPRAVEIGRARFKKICLAATGEPVIETPEDIQGKPFYLKMKNRPQRNGQSSFEIESISNEPFPDVESPSNQDDGFMDDVF